MPRPHLLALLIAAALPAACTPPPSAPEPPTAPPEVRLPESVRLLEVPEAATLLQTTPGLVIVDLREDWEIRKFGRISGSVWVDALNDERLQKGLAALDPQKPHLLYCALGGRSRQVAATLAARGFTQLHLLSGGLEAWLAAGQPVEKGS